MTRPRAGRLVRARFTVWVGPACFRVAPRCVRGGLGQDGRLSSSLGRVAVRRPQICPQRNADAAGDSPLHMILTNVCSVDITAFTLEVNVTSPIPQARQFGMDVVGALARHSDKEIPQAGAEFPFDWTVRHRAEIAGADCPLGGRESDPQRRPRPLSKGCRSRVLAGE
jgi:hypothetical protein